MSESEGAKIRLYVEQPLVKGGRIVLDEKQSHYLSRVMRLPIGHVVSCFNGQDGEFKCRLESIEKKNVILSVEEQTRTMCKVPDIWLMFAPVKKDCTDFIIAKAVELGADKIVPVITRFTQSGAVREDRFRAQAAEAAEQCRRLDVPEILPAISFRKLLDTWDEGRHLFFMDESGGGVSAIQAFSKKQKSAALLIGPEGGFSQEELAILRQSPFASGVSLGPRILRAETAVAASLSVWQSVAGDWK